ncbi:MAG TPA: ATPase domain-containing protein [Nitrososphaerales archaeon]|nr:ATPase domain-containing protein [Nitrososphaerales archaeon]
MARVRTGIAELDRMLGGGFLEGDAVLVAGGAGTGKTTLAMQYLVNGVAQGEPGIYLTFEVLPEQLYRDAMNFGWDLRKMEDEDNLRIICTSPNLIVEDSGTQAILGRAMNEVHPKRIVVDSVSHISMYVKEEDLRRELYRTLMYFKTRKTSSLLLWEAPQFARESMAISDAGMSFLTDAVVLLKFVEIESTIRHAIVVLKMRGSDHEKNLREYVISKGGILMKDTFGQFEGIMTGNPHRAPSDKFLEMFAKAGKS